MNIKSKFLPGLLATAISTTAMAAQYNPGEGKTLLLVGQTFQQEFDNYVQGVGISPAGSSHYGTIYSGTIEQGDDQNNNAFLSYVESELPDGHALIALSFKDNPGAGGFSSTVEGVRAVANGEFDAEIDNIANIMASNPNLKYLLRIGYEVSLYGFEDVQAYKDAYNHVANRIRNVNGVNHVDFVYHPVRGFNDAREMYPGGQYVDWVALSVFNNDVCLPVGDSENCVGQRVDGNIEQVFDWARDELGKPLMIAESAVQAPASETVSGFNDYLSRLHDLIVNDDVQALVYINSDWNAHNWPVGIWGDSRVEVRDGVRSYWLNNFADNSRFINYDGQGTGGGSGGDVGGGVGGGGTGGGTGGATGEFSLDAVSQTSATYSFANQPGWPTNGDYYVCKDGEVVDCFPGELNNGRWEYTHNNLVIGESYAALLKVPGMGTSEFPTYEFTWTGEDINSGGSTDSGGNNATDAGGDTVIDNGGDNITDTSTNAATGEFGVDAVSETSGIYSFANQDGWPSSGTYYVCKDGGSVDCFPGELNNNRWEYTHSNLVLGQTYTALLKVPGMGESEFPSYDFTWTGEDINGGGDGGDTGGGDGGDTGGGDGGDTGGGDGGDTGGGDGGDTGGGDTGDLAKLQPLNGKTMLFVGQDLATVTDYTNAGFQTPTGVTTYVAFYEIMTTSGVAYGALGWDGASHYDNDVDWGSGPLNAHSSALGWPDSALQIGLNIAEGSNATQQTWCAGCLSQLANGGFQDNIARLAAFFNEIAPKPVYLRIGYEFDGEWNMGYDNTSNYIRAYQNIVDGLRARGVDNVAYVWQSCASPIDDILEGHKEDINDWYPGDNYVDWVGMSWFLLPNETAPVGGTVSTQIELANEVIDFAKAQSKPVMIAEATPQGYHISGQYNANISSVWDGDAGENRIAKSGQQIWNEWFVPFFNFIEGNQDSIKAVSYINANWDSQGSWGPPYPEGFWGDARVEANSLIRGNWTNELNESIWIHGSSNLLDQLAP